MSDDYLWDRSGKPDPEVERLENLLGSLRSERPAPEIPGGLKPRPGRFVSPAAARIAAAILLPLVLLAAWLSFRSKTEGWKVVSVEGAPTIGQDRIVDSGRLEVGDWLVTDSASRARLSVGMIGEALVDPNTRVRLLRARATDHRLNLALGRLQVAIWAPPRFFTVETPSAAAVDLGCTYTLEVDETGASLLHVTSGWVAFETEGRESFVPAGALCETRPEVGPGTPYLENAGSEFRESLLKLDFEAQTAPSRSRALDIVLSQSRKADALTLWHLLARLQGGERVRVFRRMNELIPPPEGVNLDGILRGDREMLDRWWNELGLEDVTWWRLWKGPPPAPK